MSTKKRITCTLAVVALMLGLSASGLAQDSSGGLPPPHPPGSPVRSGPIEWYGKAPPGWGGIVTRMKLIAPGVGWAERSQHVYFTKDGGADWSDITPPLDADAALSSIFFLDSSKGWIAINQGELPSKEFKIDLVSTTDAGATWSRTTFSLRPNDYGISTAFTAGAETVAFVDPLHGWMNVGFGGDTPNSWSKFLLLTSDGGRTWKRAAEAPELTHTQMLLVSPSEEWLFGVDDDTNRRLYVTRDGARSWQEVAPEPAGLAYSHVMGLPTFNDARHGFLQVNGIPGSVQKLKLTMVLLATSDGGRTWKPDRTVANLDGKSRRQYRSPTVVGSEWIFAASSDHHPVLTRVAAGASIDARTAPAATRPLYGAVRHLSFATPADGWVVVNDGGLMATADGGATWTDISPGPKPHIIHPLGGPSSGESPSERTAPAAPIPSPTGLRGPNRGRLTPNDSFGQNAPPSKHLGFDVSHTGTTDEMQAWWNYSPYHDVGVYLNGAIGHIFEDPNLFNADWVNTVTGYGWGLIPIWFGPQNPCATKPKNQKISFPYDSDPVFNIIEGQLQARRAVSHALGSGFPPASIIYYDMEGYDPSCTPITRKVGKPNHNVSINGRSAAVSFLQGWVAGLHAQGFRAGVYMSGSNANDLQAINPDAVWVSLPGPISGSAHLASIWQLQLATGTLVLSDSQFANEQRIHQYDDGPCTADGDCPGIDDVEWGNAFIDDHFGDSQLIDLDIEDAPVVGGGGTKTFPGGFTEWTFNNAGACDAAPPPGPFATCETYATGINDPDLDSGQQYGQITGFFYVNNFTPSGAPSGYLSEDGFVTIANNYLNWGALDCPDDIDYGVNTTLPLGINNLGTIVGGYDDSDDNLWAFTGSIVPNSPGGACLSEALGFSFNGINDIGWIVGYDVSQSQNFLFGDTGELPLTAMPDGAQGLNGFGQVVGNDSSFLGVLVDYNPNSGLSSPFPEMSDSASGISNGVEVALQNGYLLQDPDSLAKYYEYSASTSPTFLGINDYNEVVGFEENPEYPYSDVGVLLLPNP